MDIMTGSKKNIESYSGGKYLSYVLALFIGLLIFSHNAQATIACEPSTRFPAITIVPNVTVSSSTAGNDLPLGSTIYSLQNGYSVSTLGIYCDAPFTVGLDMRTTSMPSGAPTMMNTLYGNVPVFPTNVAGVGVVIWKNGNSSNKYFLTSTIVDSNTAISHDSAGDSGIGPHVKYFGLALVKTGPIASGAVVNGSSFPHWVWDVRAQSGYSGLPITVLTASYTGTSTFVTKTCTTPASTVVDLGKYDVTDATFSGPGVTTKWVDSSIVLNNCPEFSGYHGYSGYQTIDGSGAPTDGSRTANIFTISVSPANSVSGNVIGLDAVAGAASGVGVQLGYTPGDISAAATSPTTIWTAGETWDLTPPAAGGTVKIPLAARYYQTASKITPGIANTQVVINIYYK
ncbi:fimbrial protein [Enterobacter sp. CC120223-11]|uniref:fimbrial protein n=1 Tax=Enterobacter sp. CC120223-11 TaxID=1378073 RepID=UPI001143C95A|nr:fimbrial protein [Enterobacter sp. CC120223-11]